MTHARPVCENLARPVPSGVGWRREGRERRRILKRRGEPAVVTTWRALALVSLLAVIFAAWTALDGVELGLGLLFVLPVALAARWWGRPGGLGIAAVSGGLVGVGFIGTSLSVALPGTAIRLALFAAVGYLLAGLFHRERELTGVVAQRDREILELRAIQEALVPAELPARPALELASCYVPAQHGVGGDFFMVAEGPGDATIVVIGDVVGKGLEAARRASFVRTAFATFVPFSDDPCRLLQLANTSLIEKVGVSEQFVTAACVCLRPGSGEVAWAAAGHPPPMRLDDGHGLNGVPPAVPLGIEVDIHCTQGQAELPAGTGLLLFTDGLSEARRPWGHQAEPGGPGRERFGDQRIGQLLSAHRGEDPTEVVRALRAAAEEFSGGALDDDLCILALRAREPAALAA